MSKLARVKYGTAQLPSGKKIEVGFRQWYEWLEHPETKSFRVDDGEGYTARKETAKGYWYAYRKVEGKLHKRYIGRSKALTLRRLAEVEGLFDIPSTPKLPKPVGNSKASEELHNKLGNLRAENLELHNQVTQLKAELAQVLAQSDKQSEKREKWINELLEENRLLRHRVQELEGTGVLLRIEESKNKELEQERKELREQLNGLLELQTSQAQELREVRTQLSKQSDLAYDKDVIALRKQLTAEIERFKETENSLRGNDVSWQMRLTAAKNELGEANAKLLRQCDTNRKLEREVSQLREQLPPQTAQDSPIWELPDAATLLSQLRSRRKKSTTTLADVEIILEMVEKTGND